MALLLALLIEERENNMEIVILERLRKNPREIKSRIKTGNVVLNITSHFDGNSQLDELLFHISEQKIFKTIHEETTVGTFDTSSNTLI